MKSSDDARLAGLKRFKTKRMHASIAKLKTRQYFILSRFGQNRQIFCTPIFPRLWYFTKWVDAIPLKNQTAATITEKLVQVFSVMGLLSILHSDLGRNFESTLLQQTLDAFGTSKSHTTAYHPEGDGTVKRFNRSLLQMLRMYVDNVADWEQHLPLVLYTYRTSVHSSTGIEPYVLMFGKQPLTASTGLEPVRSIIVYTHRRCTRK